MLRRRRRHHRPQIRKSSPSTDSPPAHPFAIKINHDQLQGRVDSIDTKIKRLEAELAQCREQLKTAKGPAQTRIKQRALHLLKQKKMYESQRGMTENQQFNFQQTTFALDTAKDNINQVRAMKEASKQIQKENKKLNLSQVEVRLLFCFHQPNPVQGPH